MGMLTRFFFAFLEGLLEPSHNDDPEIFGMFGRPYDGDGMTTGERAGRGGSVVGRGQR